MARRPGHTRGLVASPQERAAEAPPQREPRRIHPGRPANDNPPPWATRPRRFVLAAVALTALVVLALLLAL